MSCLGNMKNICKMQSSQLDCLLEYIIIYERYVLKPKEIVCNCTLSERLQDFTANL